MKRMGEWARRVGGVRALGVGEFNGHTAAAITNATVALGADPLFAWGCVWNSDGGIATVLTGDRLAAFQDRARELVMDRGGGGEPPPT